MRANWLKLVDRVARPTRTRLERCLKERDRYLAAQRPLTRVRARALAGCEARIESARAEVFAADDGVVTARMTELEREWLALSRRDTDGEMMELWSRIVPAAWLDRKRWRDAQPEARIEVALALASDLDGVEAAEASALAMAQMFALGSRVRWQKFEHDFELPGSLFAEPLASALSVLAAHGSESVVFDRAQVLEREIAEAARRRFPGRDALVAALGHAAFVDCVWRAAALASPLELRANPVAPLTELWRTGYLLSAIDARGVTLGLPALDHSGQSDQ